MERTDCEVEKSWFENGFATSCLDRVKKTKSDDKRANFYPVTIVKKRLLPVIICLFWSKCCFVYKRIM